MALTITPYPGQGWTNDSEPDLSAETLNAVDAGITLNSEAINAIANAIVNQFLNDPEKIASAALVYALKQSLDTTNSNLSNLTTTVNGYHNRSILPATTDTSGRVLVNYHIDKIISVAITDKSYICIPRYLSDTQSLIYVYDPNDLTHVLNQAVTLSVRYIL